MKSYMAWHLGHVMVTLHTMQSQGCPLLCRHAQIVLVLGPLRLPHLCHTSLTQLYMPRLPRSQFQ